MPRLARATGAFLLAASSLLAAPARADLVVPGRVETCTMEKQARPDAECLACRAYYGNPEHCQASLASFGFTRVCRGDGASTWGEIWCRAQAANGPKVPPNVLGQLNDPVNGLRVPPAPTARTPEGPASAAPTAAPTAQTPPPGPPPTPPPQGCACGLTGDAAGPLAASFVALAATAIAVARRRRR